MTKRHVFFLCTSLVGACVMDEGPEEVDDALGTIESAITFSSYQVTPSATEPFDLYADPGHSIGTAPDANPAPNFVYVPTWSGQIHFVRLLVFLHGNGGMPAGYTELMQTAAQNGYNVIGLSFPWMAGDSCLGVADEAACFGDLEQERVFGTDEGPASTISTHPQDAVFSRLRALLLYLRANHPEQGWGNFVDLLGELNWKNITLGGHSLGANTAAFLAHRFEVPRVVLFSGVVDAPDTFPVQSADWLTTPSATPGDRYYGLAHTNDLNSAAFTVWRVSKILNNWNTLGLPGVPTSVDGAALPPYGGSHRLKTSRCLDVDPNDSVACAAQSQGAKESAAHNKIVANGPQNDPYLAAWTYMLTN
jgi:pimeloyl-ACP methyl ester carboxylesterase